MSIYEKVHHALRSALMKNGERAELVTETPSNSESFREQAGQRPTPNAQFTRACFANPVRADVMLNGRKVAGAAQRRTRRGLLHQGSIQNVAVGNGLAERFARGLASKTNNCEIDNAIVQRAEEIARQKYGTEAWLRKR